MDIYGYFMIALWTICGKIVIDVLDMIKTLISQIVCHHVISGSALTNPKWRLFPELNHWIFKLNSFMDGSIIVLYLYNRHDVLTRFTLDKAWEKQILRYFKQFFSFSIHFHDEAIKGNIFRVTGSFCGEFHSPRPVTRSFGISFYLRLEKRLSKKLWGCWFEKPLRPFWRHCIVLDTFRSLSNCTPYELGPFHWEILC